jgi:ADP-heptose:LPS heptosyltransferase
LLTHARPARPREHASEQALGLARLALDAHAVPAARPTPRQSAPFRVSANARAAVADHWARRGLTGRTVVAVQPTAGARLKSWPIERWAAVVDGLAADGLSVALVGGPDDARALDEIEARLARPPALSLTGQSLDRSAAIFERCALLVGLDGGAAHLAAAVGTPTVRLYGPAPADVYGPQPGCSGQRVLVTTRLACVPCGNLQTPPCGARAEPACLLALDAGEVLKAVRQQLAQV